MDLYPYELKRIVTAIILQAVKDTESRDNLIANPAHTWLTTQGTEWAQIIKLGVDLRQDIIDYRGKNQAGKSPPHTELIK